MCPFISSCFDNFCDHLFKRHCNGATTIIHCSVCGASFNKKVSFRSHYYRKHFHDLGGQHIGNESVTADSRDVDEMETEVDNNTIDCSESTFLLKLKAGHRLSQNAVADVMCATKELLNLRCTSCSANCKSTVFLLLIIRLVFTRTVCLVDSRLSTSR